jgi:hypothetical protein
VAFSTVFQAFLTTFLIDSGYKTPIKNKDELYESGIKLLYLPKYSFIFEFGDETEVSKVQRKFAYCPSYEVCNDWAKYHKNVSILFPDIDIEILFAEGLMLGENSEPLVCRLEDGVLYDDGLRMVIFHGDPLIRRVTEIIDRVVEAVIYSLWISQYIEKYRSSKVSLVHPLDEYYSFNLYHMQPAFYLLLMGLCLSVFFLMGEMLYNRVFSKTK